MLTQSKDFLCMVDFCKNRKNNPRDRKKNLRDRIEVFYIRKIELV